MKSSEKCPSCRQDRSEHLSPEMTLQLVLRLEETGRSTDVLRDDAAMQDLECVTLYVWEQGMLRVIDGIRTDVVAEIFELSDVSAGEMAA